MKYENDKICGMCGPYSWHDENHRYYYHVGEVSSPLCKFSPGGYDAVFQHIHEFLRCEYPTCSVVIESNDIYVAYPFNSYGLGSAEDSLAEFQAKRVEYLSGVSSSLTNYR